VLLSEVLSTVRDNERQNAVTIGLQLVVIIFVLIPVSYKHTLDEYRMLHNNVVVC